MWAHVTEQTYLYEGTFMALVSWLQIAANLLGIFLIWLIYSDLVLRLSWVPSTIDALFPFVVGILEFAQISLLGPDNIGLWFAIISALFAAMAWISQFTMRRARQEEENAEYFEGLNPATWRDHFRTAIPVLLLATCGVVLWLSGDIGWFACVALLAVNLLLLNQIRVNHVFTQRAYAR